MMNRTHSIRQLILAAGLILSILLTGAAGIAFAEEPAAPAEKQAAKVVFEGANPFVLIALYPKPTEENSQPEAIKPEADGTWLLPAGEYVYTAAAEGFVPVEAAPLSVPAEDAAEQKTITVALTLQPAQTFTAEAQPFTEELLPPVDIGLTAETMEEDLSAEAIDETPMPKAEGPDAVAPEAGNTDDVNPDEELPEEAQSDPGTPDDEEKADSADAADADEGETADEAEEPAADSTEEAADEVSSAGDEEAAGEADEPDKEASEDGEEQGEEKASEAEEEDVDQAGDADSKDTDSDGEAPSVVPAAPVLATGLTYTGEPQSLITAMNPGLWIRIETAAAADDPAGQTAVTGEWILVEDFQNADKAAFSRIDAGTYLVYWYAGEEAPGPQEEGQPAGEVEIARAAAVILVAPH